MSVSRKFAAIAALLAVTSYLAAGCTVSKSDKKETTLGIPPGAVQVQQGTDRINYDVARSGTVYVYDVDQDRLVYQGPVRSGDRLTVDPSSNHLELNGRQVVDRDLKRGDQHRIYFYSDRQRDSATPG